MASTVTSTPSDLTLSAGFNSTKSGKISWTAPTVPDGATIKSCVLTGNATASSTKVSSIKINNQSITVSTSGYNFTINLGKDNSITSVTATMTKSERWKTHTVNFTNMIYTVTYELASVSYTVTFKDWDGTVLKTETVASGGAASAPSNPTRSGYTFSGWDKDYNHVTSDLVVTAQYTKNPIITFIQNSGGYVLCNGTRYVGNSTVSVQRGSNVNIIVYANENYYIKSIQMSGFDNLIEDPNARETTYPFDFENIHTDEGLTIEYARVDGTEEPPTTPSTSNILIGNNRVNKIYIGNTSISKVYLGNTRLL